MGFSAALLLCCSIGMGYAAHMTYVRGHMGKRRGLCPFSVFRVRKKFLYGKIKK
jgi:hypothetical protein